MRTGQGPQRATNQVLIQKHCGLLLPRNLSGSFTSYLGAAVSNQNNETYNGIQHSSALRLGAWQIYSQGYAHRATSPAIVGDYCTCREGVTPAVTHVEGHVQAPTRIDAVNTSGISLICFTIICSTQANVSCRREEPLPPASGQPHHVEDMTSV